MGCLLGPLYVIYHLILKLLCLFFVCFVCPKNLSIEESRVLKSPTIVGFVFICFLNSVSKLFMIWVHCSPGCIGLILQIFLDDKLIP